MDHLLHEGLFYLEGGRDAFSVMLLSFPQKKEKEPESRI